jgi:hypothetical protein
MRRFLPILGLLVVLLAGCGGAQTAQQTARKDFLFKYPNLDDQQLAKLCPGFYPTDYLNPKRAKHYHYTKDKAKKFVFSAAVKLDAAAVPGCKQRGTKPKD